MRILHAKREHRRAESRGTDLLPTYTTTLLAHLLSELEQRMAEPFCCAVKRRGLPIRPSYD
jgi:hypothetical protein